VLIASELLDELIQHALADPANEVCGVLSVAPGPPARAVRSYRATNIHRSPYHSHVRSAPHPSQTDIAFAANWPGVEWIIIGLGNGEPEVRSFLIDGSRITEVPLEVVQEEPAP
jgi:proteasome lid subunit RPN8/RPN11